MNGSMSQPKLYSVEMGDPTGLPLVFINPFPLTHSIWKAQWEDLPTRVRAIAYDTRGFGQSPLGEGTSTLEAFVDDLRGLLDAKEVETAVLCGLSMGGYTALRFVEKYPERVKGLVLCNTRSQADDAAAKLKREENIKLLETEGAGAFAKRFVAAAISHETRKQQPALEKNLIEMIAAQDFRAIVGALQAMLSRSDTTESLFAIRTPTLVIHGEKDALVPVDQGKAMALRISGAAFAAIPGVGHLANLEAPRTFNNELVSFLYEML
jgi:pimeloyl-ACP methyl ester carboxylesterase